MIRFMDPIASRVTSATVGVPPDVFRALTVPGRAVVTEATRAPMPLASSSGAGGQRTIADMLRNERPVLADAAVRLNVATRSTLGRAPSLTTREQVVAGLSRVTPERPRYSAIVRPANTLAQAAANRQARKRASVQLLGSARPILTAGVAPSDLANGIATPDRGTWPVNPTSFPAGTSQVVRESGESVSTIGGGTLELGASTVTPEKPTPVTPAIGAADSAQSMIFLVGALVLGYMALKGAA